MQAGEADIAVHSMKDVPVELPEGLHLAVILQREDPRDAFVSNNYASLDALPDGAKVGTSSLRRRCQLLAAHPEFEVVDLRGNVDTRLRKLSDGEYDAIILACAGLDGTDAEAIMADTCRNLFDGVKEKDVSQTLVMSARTLIDQEPNYSQAAARLLLDTMRREALGFLGLDTGVATQHEMGERYSEYFSNYIKRGADLEHWSFLTGAEEVVAPLMRAVNSRWALWRPCPTAKAYTLL